MLSVNESLSQKDAIGIGRKGTIDNSQILHAPFWAVDTLFFLTLKQDDDLNFIYYKFQNINWKKYDESTGVPSLTKNTINKIKIYLPSITEQITIKKILNSLDNFLTLYERKIKSLKLIKKYLLNNLFTMTTHPKLRFKGFYDEWKKDKLIKFLSIPDKEKVIVDSPLKILTVKLNLRGLQAGSNRSTLKLNSTNYYTRRAGQLIYGKQNIFNGSIAIIPKKFDKFVTSGDVPSFNIHNINNKFLYYYITRKTFYKKTEIYATGTGSKRVHESTFLNFDIIYSENINEQKKISQFLDSIIKIINLYDTEISKLKLIKCKLLNCMFI